MMRIPPSERMTALLKALRIAGAMENHREKTPNCCEALSAFAESRPSARSDRPRRPPPLAFRGNGLRVPRTDVNRDRKTA